MRNPVFVFEEWESDKLWHRLVLWPSGNLSVQYYEPADGIWYRCPTPADHLVVFNKKTTEMVSENFAPDPPPTPSAAVFIQKIDSDAIDAVDDSQSVLGKKPETKSKLDVLASV